MSERFARTKFAKATLNARATFVTTRARSCLAKYLNGAHVSPLKALSLIYVDVLIERRHYRAVGLVLDEHKLAVIEQRSHFAIHKLRVGRRLGAKSKICAY